MPTPWYNNAIIEDITYLTHKKIIHGVIEMCPIIKQASMVLKIWLTQRQLRYGLDVLDSHSSTLFLSYLFQTKRINPSMTAMAIFQVIMKFLADITLPCILNFNSIDIQNESHGHIHEGISLIHPIGNKDKYIEYNAFWRISAATWMTIKSDAVATLQILQSKENDKIFQQLFLSKILLIHREDFLFHLSLPYETALNLCKVSFDERNETLIERFDDFDRPHWCHVYQAICQDVTKALTDRYVSITTNITIQSDHILPISHPVVTKDVASNFVISIGVTLALDKATRIVDRGPSYDQADLLQQFRDFWGDKCQLRRFQDGSIVESILWSVQSWNAKTIPSNLIENQKNSKQLILKGSMIIGEIIRYITSKRYAYLVGSNGERIKSGSLTLEESQRLIELGAINESKSIQMSKKSLPGMLIDATMSSKNTIEALDSLRTILTSKIVDMPIMIEHLQGLDPELRYTNTIPSTPHPLLLLKTTDETNPYSSIQGKRISLLVKPILVLGTLESSGKWPTDPVAIAKLKAGIHLKLLELLKKQFQVCFVCRSNTNGMGIVMTRKLSYQRYDLISLSSLVHKDI